MKKVYLGGDKIYDAESRSPIFCPVDNQGPCCGKLCKWFQFTPPKQRPGADSVRCNWSSPDTKNGFFLGELVPAPEATK